MLHVKHNYKNALTVDILVADMYLKVYYFRIFR